MKRAYETVVVYDGALPEDGVAREVSAITALVNEGGTLIKTAQWGRRELAYPIRRRRSGIYVLFIYEADTSLPARLGRQVRLNESVLRHLTVVHDPDARISVPRETVMQPPEVVAAAEPVGAKA